MREFAELHHNAMPEKKTLMSPTSFSLQDQTYRDKTSKIQGSSYVAQEECTLGNNEWHNYMICCISIVTLMKLTTLENRLTVKRKSKTDEKTGC